MLNIGNSVALMALLSWPLVIILMFRLMTLERALIWSILGGYMLLPQISEINLPGIPAFNKTSIPNLTVLVVIIVMLGRMPQLLPRTWPGRLLIVALVLSPAFTVLNNLEPIRFGIQRLGSFTVFDRALAEQALLPGLRPYDALTEVANQIIFLLPLFLARRFLRSEEAIRELLRALVIGAMIYALPMLFEIRFSPQLHTWIYGFFQHQFGQTIRFGGFRPIVFMPHGLWLALFILKALLAAVALTQMAKPDIKGRMVALCLFLAIILILCRSVGPVFFALALLPLLLFTPPRMHVFTGMSAATLVMAYPLLRGGGLIPTDAIVARVAAFDEDRAQSLGFRFMNEDAVLNHVADKPLLGWGGWGRFVPHDPLSGRSETIVDGMWIITIGHYGWVGYIALFGLLTLPLFSLWWQSRRSMAPAVPFAVSALALIYTANLLDMLPNATLVPLTVLIGGALLGHAELIRERINETLLARRGAARPARMLGKASQGRRSVL